MHIISYAHVISCFTNLVKAKAWICGSFADIVWVQSGPYLAVGPVLKLHGCEVGLGPLLFCRGILD